LFVKGRGFIAENSRKLLLFWLAGSNAEHKIMIRLGKIFSCSDGIYRDVLVTGLARAGLKLVRQALLQDDLEISEALRHNR
jgi:hypothetical protein